MTMKLWTCPIPTCRYQNVNRATCFVQGCTGHADRATKKSQVREREGVIGINA